MEKVTKLMPAPNELRLFLSSTFIDFQAERDYLTKKVFPALRRMCRERGVEFTEIDLRWGLTDEDAEQGRIIGTCLEEIDNCRPFFLGMLGERYGWVPSATELAKDPELVNNYPWIEESFATGQSVTEMEFRHGFLNADFGSSRPLVYFRSKPDEPPTDERIIRLRHEVRDALGTVPEFAEPSELGAFIERDLTELIERHWPLSQKNSWLEEERSGHAAFAQSRRKGYVPSPTVIDRMDAQLDATEPVLIVTGESGLGKSSLLAYWTERLRKKDPNLFIVEHFVGVTSASTDSNMLVRRIISEIHERIHSEDPVPQSNSELDNALPSWLGRLSGERLVIVVDAINQMSTQGHFLHWLPNHFQNNIRWVISATEGDALERLRDRKRMLDQPLVELAVQPISLNDRRRVLQMFLAGYQKKLDTKQEEKIIADEKTSNPLFLRTLLEELRLQGKHEELDHHIDHYLESTDIPNLFARILERFEFDYGSNVVQTFLTRIWSAPYGLSESELIESSDLDRATLSVLLHSFDYHLLRTQGRLNFFHDHLRQAVEGRYLDESRKKRIAWKELAEYFEETEASSIKALSLPWLLEKAEAWNELKSILLDITLVPYLAEGSRSYDLLTYWLQLERLEESRGTKKDEKKLWHIDVVTEYEAGFQNLQEPLTALEECRIRYALGLFFRNAGWHEGAARNERRALDLCERLPADTPGIFELKLDISTELAKAYLDRSDFKNASEVLENALILFGDEKASLQDPSKISDVRHINFRNEYARLLKDMGKYAEAEIVSRSTLTAALEKFGEAHYTVQNEMKWLADIITVLGKFDEAEKLHRAVIKSIEVTLGEESLDLAYYLNEFGKFFWRRGFRREVSSINGSVDIEADYDYMEGQKAYGRAVNIIERRLGTNHTDLAILLANFSGLHSQNGSWEKAEPLILRSLSISEMAFGPIHASVALGINNYADILFRQGKLDQAEIQYRRNLDLRMQLFGENNPETATALNNLANVLRREGKFDEALLYYDKTISIRLKTVGEFHEDTARVYEGYGITLREIKNFVMAESFLNKCFEIRKQIFGLSQRDTIRVAIELAEVLLTENKLKESNEVIQFVKKSANSKATFPNEVLDIYEKVDDCLKEKFVAV